MAEELPEQRAGAGAIDQDGQIVGMGDFDVPVTVPAVLGSSKVAVGDLLQIVPGAVLELDRRVGEAIDIFVNERLVARGEVVVVEDRLGVTMTEIIKADR